MHGNGRKKVSLLHFRAKKESIFKNILILALWTIQTSKKNRKKSTKLAENNQDEKFYNQIYMT